MARPAAAQSPRRHQSHRRLRESGRRRLHHRRRVDRRRYRGRVRDGHGGDAVRTHEVEGGVRGAGQVVGEAGGAGEFPADEAGEV